MKDEDYAFETQRQKRLDENWFKLEALLAFKVELERLSHHEESAHRYGFLCTALQRILLPVEQRDFIKGLIDSALGGASILPTDLPFGGDYLGNPPMFEAINHAYRLGMVDQWITNQKEK
jgi:hypothetical protein